MTLYRLTPATSRPMPFAALLLTAALLTATLLGTVLFASTPARADVRPGSYVALGDSYSSGVGAPPYATAEPTCERSPLGYPQQWAKAHPQDAFVDTTCSGYTIDQIATKQVGKLNADTTLVTLTAGGVDDGFTGTAKACLGGGDAQCAKATEAGSTYARNTLPGRMAGLLGTIRAAAPNARILLLGYPRLIAPTGSCGFPDPSAAERTAMNANADAVADALADAARQAGVDYVDVRDAFADHQACGPDPWINRYDAMHVEETFHPNATGYAQVYLAALNHYAG